MFSLFGAIIVGGATGYAAEHFRMVGNGIIVSVALGIGGAVALWFLQGLFGIGLGLGRMMTSIIGAAALLFLAAQRR